MLGETGGTWERRPDTAAAALPDPDQLALPDTLEDVPQLRAEYLRWYAEHTGGGLAPRESWLVTFVRERRSGLLLPALCFLVVLASALGGLAGLSRSRPAPATTGSEPLATVDAPDGTVGGLLPALALDTVGIGPDEQVALRDLRPTVVAVVPTGCATCAEVLAAVHLQAASYGSRLVMLGSTIDRPALEALDRAVGNGAPVAAVGPASALAAALPAATAPNGSPLLRLLVVGSDGVVQAIADDPSPGVRLESALGRAAAGLAPVTIGPR